MSRKFRKLSDENGPDDKEAKRSVARAELGEKFTEVRVAAGFQTKYALSMAAKVSLPIIARIEAGKTTGPHLTVAKMHRIAEVCSHTFHVDAKNGNWNHTTTLGTLFNMEAEMTFIPLLKRSG